MGLNKPVNFTTAKLLKEKGFDENTKFGFNGVYEPHHLNIIEFGYLQRNSELLHNVYSAPTIADVITWLYEKHGIWIEIFPCKTWNGVCFDYKINKIMGDNWKVIPNKSTFDCYIKPTEAYEDAIEYVIKNLI